jgi:protein YIPF6
MVSGNLGARKHCELYPLTLSRGPLLFSLLLSFLLSRGAADNQKAAVFSGVFAMVWIGSAIVTLQIKLLGGNM